MPAPAAIATTDARICGSCGLRTSAAVCPADGAPTYRRATADTAELRLEPGQVLAGKYRVTGRLGRGGFAAVYSAQQLATGQAVAVKVLTLDDDDDDTVVLRFMQEAQVTARLRHPNTVRVFDFGQTDAGALFLVLELLRGPTLEAVLRDHAKRGTVMSEREALTLVMPLLRALAEAHDAGLVHRDLKPHNLILADTGDEEPTIKVLDFGVARVADSDLTGTGKALGTPTYMSPEQCLGATLDGRSDLYAVGVILFRMVTGRAPFESDNVMRLLQMQVHDPVPDLRVVAKQPVSDGFAALVGRALHKSPDGRFASAKEMRKACEALVGGAWGGTPLQTLLDGAGSATNGLAHTLALDVAAPGVTLPATVAVDRAAEAPEPTRIADTTAPIPPGATAPRAAWAWVVVALLGSAAVGLWRISDPTSPRPVAALAPAQMPLAPAPVPADVASRMAASPVAVAPVAAAPVPTAVAAPVPQAPAAPPTPTVAASPIVAPKPAAARPARTVRKPVVRQEEPNRLEID